MKRRLLAALLAALMVAPSALFAEDDARASYSPRKIDDAREILRDASVAYQNLIKDGKVPASVLDRANCIAIFPQVKTAALAVGGMHGDGIAMCRDSGDEGESAWSNPAFLNLTGGSLGLQAGVKSADVVLYMTGENAKSSLQNPSFRLAGELSAVAGSFDRSFEPPSSGVVAYSRTSGVFAGASVVGVSISHDEDEQREFYGSYSPSSIMDGELPSSLETAYNELKNMLPG